MKEIFDKILEDNNVALISGGAGVGKSTLILNLAKYCGIDRGIGTFFGSDEMSEVIITDKLISEIESIDMSKLKNRMSVDDMEDLNLKIDSGINTLVNNPIYCEYWMIDRVKLYSLADMYKRNYGIEIFCWDRIGFGLPPESYRDWVRDKLEPMNKIINEFNISVITSIQTQGYDKIKDDLEVDYSLLKLRKVDDYHELEYKGEIYKLNLIGKYSKFERVK